MMHGEFGERMVTAITVTYNSASTISIMLESLAPSVESGLARSIVVDNASQDGTAELILRDYPWVQVVRSRENLGFARGCNLGFNDVDTPYVLFLNPDAQLADAALLTLLEFMESRPDVAVTAPATQIGTGAWQLAGVPATPRERFATPWEILPSSLTRTSRKTRKTRPVPFGAPPFETNWVCGGVMLIRSSSFRRVGGFDPRYFLYFEETDLFLRILEQGDKMFVVGAAKAFHIGGVSAESSGEDKYNGCITEHYFKSRYYYFAKNFGFPRATLAETACALVDTWRVIRSFVLGKPLQPSAKPWRRPFLRLPVNPPEDRGQVKRTSDCD